MDGTLHHGKKLPCQQASSQQCLTTVQGLKGTVGSAQSFRLKQFAATFYFAPYIKAFKHVHRAEAPPA